MSSAQEIRSVKAVKTASPKIDGNFHIEEWYSAEVITDFIQTEPIEGIKASESTKAYILYDDKNLYIGVQCFDREPSKIAAQLDRRDNISNSDYIAIFFDTFHDHRTGFSFATTPYGTKIDAYIYNDDSETTSWNGIWDVKTKITDYGWIAEFVIPFKTLKFNNLKEQTWGLNIKRRIERKKEDSYWQTVRRNDGLRASKFGHLTNLVGISTGINLRLLPYVIGNMSKERGKSLSFGSRGDRTTGIDLQYGITTNLIANLTLYPDFAQIEADPELINLSRYPLFYPEKRPFFIEGCDIFKTSGNIYSNLFYSRRINEPLYGLKITGKISGFSLGFINVINDNDLGIQNKINSGFLSSDYNKRSNFTIFRIKKDVFSTSEVGLIAMSKDYSGNYTRILGIDGTIRFKNHEWISYKLVKSFSTGVSGKSHSLNIFVGKNSDFFNCCYWYTEKAPGFVGNELGFYNYFNLRDAGGWMQIAPRIEKYNIRRIKINLNFWGENYWNKHFFRKDTFSRGGNFDFNVQTMNYWMFGAGKNKGKNFDRIVNVLYDDTIYWLWLSSNRSKKFTISINHSQGDYRGGYRWSYSTDIGWKPTGRMSLLVEWSRSLTKPLNLETGKIEINLFEVFRTKLIYSFSRDVSTRTIIQYNRRESKVDVSFLFSYNFKPGSFLYIAYNELLNRYDNNVVSLNRGYYKSTNRVIKIKYSYLFQI